MLIIDDLIQAVWAVTTDWAIAIAEEISPAYANLLRVSRDTVEESIKRQIIGLIAPIVVRTVQEKWGIVLNSSDPFTRQSVSGGIGQKIGMPLRDVFDKETLLQDIGAGLAGLINSRFGTSFSTFWPLETLQNEVETQVFSLLNSAVDELHAETKAGLKGAEGG